MIISVLKIRCVLSIFLHIKHLLSDDKTLHKYCLSVIDKKYFIHSKETIEWVKGKFYPLYQYLF